VLPALPAGVTLVDQTKVPYRDCEGPSCMLHLTFAGSPSALPDLVRVMRADGWESQAAAYPGQVALCKRAGGLFAGLSTRTNRLRAFPGTAASWPAPEKGELTLVLLDARGSCP
jgi:hypothetical protein